MGLSISVPFDFDSGMISLFLVQRLGRISGISDHSLRVVFDGCGQHFCSLCQIDLGFCQ